MKPDGIETPKQSKQSKQSNGQRGGHRPGAGRRPGAMSKAKLELRDLAKEHVPGLLKTLVDIAKGSPSDSARVAAIKEVMDRAYGKAPQALTGEDGGPMKQVIEVVWASTQRAQ